MPYKPKRPCTYPSCGRLVESGEQYCTEHKRLIDKQYNKYKRDPNLSKHYGRAWKLIRDRYARDHPLCEMCVKERRLAPVDEVHHILPVSQGGTHERENLMSLCRSCHNKIHINEIGDRQ